MGNWYRVTKRINGRLYDYWQRTHRTGKSVKTENNYIGPAGTGKRGANAQVHDSRSHGSARSTPTVEPSFIPATAPYTPEDAREKLDPHYGLDEKWRRKIKAAEERVRREDEEIQYGNLSDRIKRAKAACRGVKKATRGITAVNPFLARATRKK